MELKDKTIVLTGGTSGIGLALVEELAPRNRLVVIARPSERLDALGARFPSVEAVGCDLADLRAVDEAARRIAAREPRIDALVNNAASQSVGRFKEAEFSAEAIGREINANFAAPCVLTRRVLAAMLRCGAPGVILNVGSALALAPKASAPVYCATKAALRSFSRSLGYQLEGTRVREVHAMLPLVDTPMTRGRGSGKLAAREAARVLIACIQNERAETRIGKARLLAAIHRLAPSVAYRILKRA